MIDQLIRRVVPAIAFGVLLAKAASTALGPVTNSDTYFHLRIGAEFLDGWPPWDPGQLSETASANWVPTQWLSQVLLASAERVGGLPAIAVIHVALVVTALLVWWGVARRRAGHLVAGVVVTLALVATSPSLSVRPQVVSYLLMTATVLVWTRACERQHVPWLLVPLTWLWAMTHGMWVLGVGASALLALAAVVQGLLPRRALLVPAAMLTAAAATPVGPALLGGVLEVSSRAEYFGEWGTPDLVSLTGLAVIALLAACALPMALARSADPFAISQLATALVLTVYDARTVPVAAAALVPLAAEQLQTLVRAREEVRDGERWLLAAGALAALGLAATLAPIRADEPPVTITAFDAELDQLPDSARVLTDSDAGGFLLWTHPELDIPVHSYGDVYTDDEIEAFDQMFDLAPGWDDTVRRLGVEDALLLNRLPLRAALEDAGWQVIQHAEGRTLLAAPPNWSEPPTIER